MCAQFMKIKVNIRERIQNANLNPADDDKEREHIIGLNKNKTNRSPT